MNQIKKNWAFTEFLGYTENVKEAIKALKDAGALHGNIYTKEDKGDKRFVQYYACDEDVSALSNQEEVICNKLATQYKVYIGYDFLGRYYKCFPNDEKNDLFVKYWEWWIAYD